ncbi:MAG: hypothetical protein R6W78_15975, partial [Bacteroidales bacterium]
MKNLVAISFILIYFLTSCSKEDEISLENHPELIGQMIEIPAGQFIRGSEAGLSIERPRDTIT